MAREMKNSGVEWIGEIPVDWEIRKNKTLFNCSKRIVGSASGQTQLLSLTTQGIKTKSQDAIGGKTPETFDTYQMVEPNDIVMCLFDLDCSAVFSGISPYKGMISPAYKVIKCKNNLYPKYANYWFMFIFDGRKFKSYAKNLRYTLNYDEFALLPIVLPSYYDQQIVARFLDKKCAEIDAVIEKTKATIEEYKKLKQSVITEAVIKGIRGDRPMKDSGIEWIGEIPAEWHIRKLFRAINKIGDIDHYMPDSIDNGIPYLMTGDLKEKLSDIDLSLCKQVLLEDYLNLSAKIKADKGDVIFARYATIGTVCFVDIEQDFLVSYSCLTIKPMTNLLIGKFLFYYLKSSAFIEEAKQYINSNTQSNVGLDSMTKVKIVLPNKQEQTEIVDYLDKKCAEIDLLITKKTNLLTELENYKKSLIYEYVTGKKECSERG